jgi:S-adenosylmethionine hydrolase
VNAGFVYSFLRDSATELGWADASDAGSQFRSRDLFPQAAADLLRGGQAAEKLGRGDIPAVPSGRVAYTDGYGNLKLTLTRDDIKEETGQAVRVAVEKAELDAVISDGSFGVEPGKLALAPGSSGWPLPKGGRVEWLELFLRGGNACEAFGRPMPGAKVRLRPGK